jgi:exonuclease III
LDKSKLLKKFAVLCKDPDIIAIQETKIDRNIFTSELFPDNFNYDVDRNDRTLNGGGE